MTSHDEIAIAEEYLAALPRFAEAGARAYRPGLERMETLMQEMGSPHGAFRSIHVAGTNGKGSTASLIAAILTASGLRTGLHTSPHLYDPSERMRIDGQPAPREWLARAVRSARPIAERVNPSYFELTTALSFAFFAEKGIDVAVVETGMGGRLDATNVLVPEVAVITDVGLDHMEFLGDTIGAIAREKAGIIKPGVSVVSGARPPAHAIIRATAAEKKAPLHSVSDETRIQNQALDLRGCSLTVDTPLRTYHHLRIELGGQHQIRNALVALRAVELAFEHTRANSVFEGMRRVRELSGIRGRFDVLSDEPLAVADVAHNPDALSGVIEHLQAMGRLGGKFQVLFGVMRDKDVSAMARILARARAVVQPVELQSERAVPAAELAEILRVHGVETATPTTVRGGLDAFLSGGAHTDTLLVTGSYLVVAQIENVRCVTA